MTEESDARIEQLEKESQESRAQMSKMMKLIRTLIRDTEQASGLNPQNQTAQPNQRKEELVYPVGFTPPYARMSMWHKHHQCNKPEDSCMAMRLPQRG